MNGFTNDMWQSRVEIEDHSVAYFNRNAVFEVPYRWTSIKGGAYMHFIAAWIANESTKCISHALNKKCSAIQRFEPSDMIEIHNGIIFDFYTGLPRMNMYNMNMYNINNKVFVTLSTD